MSTLAPSFTVIRNDRAREIHWSAVGLWTEEDLLALQKELLSKAKPFIDERVRFRVLGDLREFAVQPRDMAEKNARLPRGQRAAGSGENGAGVRLGFGQTAISPGERGARVRVFRNRARRD